MSSFLAGASVSVSGTSGWLIILAILAFAAAVIAASVAGVHRTWAICLSAGAFLVALWLIFSG